MWPWEHVVAGYVVYSITSHLWRRRAPGARETVLVVSGSLVPDLIDKPLAWSFQVVSSGYGPAHSVLITVPVIALLSTRWVARGRPWPAVAFATGYILHFSGDLLYQAMDGTIDPGVILWPVLVSEPTGERAGFVTESITRISDFTSQLIGGNLSAYVMIQLGLLAVAVLLWAYDGAPGLRQSMEWTTGHILNRR